MCQLHAGVLCLLGADREVVRLPAVSVEGLHGLSLAGSKKIPWCGGGFCEREVGFLAPPLLLHQALLFALVSILG